VSSCLKKLKLCGAGGGFAAGAGSEGAIMSWFYIVRFWRAVIIDVETRTFKYKVQSTTKASFQGFLKAMLTGY